MTTSTFICICGFSPDPEKSYPGHSGLLKDLSAQVELEEFQSRQLAKLLRSTPAEQHEWATDYFGENWPRSGSLEELICDFLYVSHRRDGCTATFHCPRCGRLALLPDARGPWIIYQKANRRVEQ